MSLYSQLCRLARRFSPVDAFHDRGMPRPIGPMGRQAGVWIAYHLDGTKLAYLVASGESSNRPVAIVFGSGGDEQFITAHDFDLAKSIAADWSVATSEPDHVFDVRGIDMRKPVDIEFTGSPAWFLFNAVLFPTDRFGRRVDDKRCAFRDGAMFSIGGGLFIACDSDVIPRDETGERASLALSSLAIERGSIPTFDMAIDGDWNSAPAGLADFIDRTNKNSGVLPASLAPGQSETNKATVAAA